MVTDARTTNRNYPKNSVDNTVAEDFARGADALDMVDADVASLLTSVSLRAMLVHGHVISDVSGLQAALDGKASSSHTHTLASLTDTDVGTVTNGQWLRRISGKWSPASIASGDVSGLGTMATESTSGYVQKSGGAAILPGWANDAGRPASPSNGWIGYNADRGLFEGYQGGGWNPIGSSAARGETVFSAATGNLTAGQTTFTVPGGYTVGKVDVLRNGVDLVVGSGVTASNGTTVVLATAALSTDVIKVRVYAAIQDLATIGFDFVENYSMPSAVAPVVIYVKSSGSDTITSNLHGTTEATAFASFDAAINHAKKYYRFTGRLNTVVFKFEGGVDWGYISLGSNLDQGEEYFPFAIKITSISNANRAIFTGITLGTWHPNYVYVTQVKCGYFAVTRRNAMTINDVSILNRVTVSYAFRSAFGGKMNVFGDINFLEAVSYSAALFYNQDMGYTSLENGDTPSIFPECNFIGLSNVTTPYIYRLVLGSAMYCPAAPYADLGSLSSGAYYVDATSYSTQTQGAIDLNKNAAAGGPIVARSGTDVSGWEKTADGKLRQWGIISISSAAVGVSSPASGALTFPVAFGANPRIRYNWALSTVIVASSAPSTTGVQLVVNNLGASAASFNVYWEATGSL